MRADSVKEAINLYEEENYRARIESMQRSIESNQRRTVKALESIEREANKTRKAAQFAAIANGITAYNTHKTRKSINTFLNK